MGMQSREEALAQLEAEKAAKEAKGEKRISLYAAQKPQKKKFKS
jgi:hypothetical protein